MDVIYNFMLENFVLFFSLLLLAVLLGTIFALILVLTKFVGTRFNGILDLMFNKSKTNNPIKPSHDLTKSAAKLIDDVNDRLAILTNAMDAVRGYIVNFHNGSVFLSEQPNWKMTINYEKTINNSKYLGPKFADVSVNLYWDNIIKLFFYNLVQDNKLPSGVEQITKNLICDVEIFPRIIYLATTSKLSYNSGPLRSNLESHKIDYLIFTPILNHNNTPVGYIGMEFKGNSEDELFGADDWTPCPICQFASYLTYIWAMDLEQLNFNNN